MTHHVYSDVPGVKLKKLVPRRFHGRLEGLRLSPQPYTVLIFSGAKDEVVQSGLVKRALADVAEGKPMLAVGTGFTLESHTILRQRGADVLTLSDFHWTDDSYQRVRHSV